MQSEFEGIENDADFDRLFSNPAVRYDFSTLVGLSNTRPAGLAEMLWKEVWLGKLTNDTFASLRHGIENNFRVSDAAALMAGGSRRRRHSRRTGFSMWKGSLPMAGNWMRIRWPEREEDLLERAEREKERVRLLLDRYGILFRELLQNELPAFSWGNIFRALRLMELSGEVLTGYFFQGVPGPQFISHEAFRMLQRKFPEESVYWICATDPASVCGIRLDALKGKLPRRVPGTHLVYHGSKLVMESRRSGKTLIFHVPENSILTCNLTLDCSTICSQEDFNRCAALSSKPPLTISLTDLQRLLSKQFDVVYDGSKLYVYTKYHSESLPRSSQE